ncbi:MAG TPA: TonB-dependent receptor [Puia sp.]
MRTGLYYILFFILNIQLLFALPSSGQNMEKTQLTLGLKNESLTAAFKKIENRTEFLFAFQPGQVAAFKKLNIPSVSRSLSATLDLLLESTGLTFRQMGHNILIYKKAADTRPIREWNENVLMADTVIHGKVTNKAGEPLAGVSVVIRGTNKGVTTGSDGSFTTMMRIGQTLNFSAVGFRSYSVKPLKGSGDLAIVLESEVSNLNDVVVVGYGTQKKADLTGAVSTVDVSKTFESKPLNDPAKALQGIVPGLTIQYGNGGLTANPDIKIRGIGSVNGTSRPLILVDNVETDDLTVLNPADIESISVLKDAASASIYGTRAAFGVVLIKTKMGHRNQPVRVTYNDNFSWSTPTTLPDFADPAKELIALDSAGRRASATTTPQLFGMELGKIQAGVVNWEKNYAKTNTGLEMIKGEDWDIDPVSHITYFYKVWDPKKLMLNKYTFSQQHNINVQGGTEKANYYVSGGYSNDQGIWKWNPDGVKKYNITGGVNISVNDWLDLNIKTTFRNYEYDYPYQYQNYWYYFWRWGSYFPLGTYQGKYFRGDGAYLTQASKSSLSDEYTRIDLGATIKILKNLNIRADYSIGRDNAIRHETGGPVNAWDFWTAGQLPYTNIASAAQNVVNYNSGRYLVNTLNAYATWMLSPLPGSHFKLIAGVNVDNNENINFKAARQGLLDPSQGELGLATGTQTAGADNLSPTSEPGSPITNPSFSPNGHGKNAYAGYFARVNYDYKGRYLLELNGRYDGSSTFPVESRWAFFPSASAGYRISQEEFMHPLQPVLSDLKFRVSYGQIGNQDLGSRSLFLPVLNGSQPNWLNGGQFVQTVTQPTAVAGSLKWERVNTLDVGTDARFFHNHIGLTVDWFERNTIGMVQPTSVPSTFGVTGPYINAGNFRTRGYEIGIDANYALSKDLTVYGNLNLSDAKTVFTKWSNPNLSISNASGINYKGKTYGEIWGFETDRYFSSDADVAKSPTQLALQSGNFKYGAGDVKYKDRNRDGKIDGGNMTLGNHGDLKVIGNTQPRYTFNARFGASYKGFDVDVFVQGVGLRHYWGAGNIVIPLYQGTDILYANQLDYWTPTHPNAKFAKPYANNNTGAIAGISQGSGSYYPQTKYLLNLAYARLKNLTAGYTMPSEWLARKGIHKLRFYVSGENLFTISHVGAPIDPEITDGESSSMGRTFPFSKTYSFGTQLTF